MFEYKILHAAHHSLTESALNELGKQGWELISVYWHGQTIHTVIMKRAAGLDVGKMMRDAVTHQPKKKPN